VLGQMLGHPLKSGPKKYSIVVRFEKVSSNLKINYLATVNILKRRRKKKPTFFGKGGVDSSI
jgi:hypothetical protein